ncbi:MAG: dihydrolipoamide acetyltransferase family protein [Solirubrobacteraceae bacterium]
MIDIAMPQLSDSMEDGTILTWLIDDGQPVARGEELVEIETDKATMTHVSDVEGILEIVVQPGETVAVGALIARVGPLVAEVEGAGNDEGVASMNGSAGGLPEGEPSVVTSVASMSSAVAPVEPTATPLATRLARAHDLELSDVTGTGPRGRITRGDVLSAAGLAAPLPRVSVGTSAPASAQARTSAEAPESAPPATGAKGGSEILELSRLQQTVARRMAETKATVPDFQVQAEVTMDAAIALRSQLKEIAEAGMAPSFNDMIVKACAVALRSHPRANGSYRDGRFELHERVNVGIAVAAEDALVVATVPDADTKSLSQIARESRRLAERVRSGEITPPELSGATFTVSNLGMFGMTAITPVINSPQAAILGVGALRETLARADGEIVDRTLLTLTLSCDHRILYGADAARLLSDIKGLLERPLSLAL